MQAKNAWWLIIVGGMVGALLWAGPVGAQPFPGGLPACRAELNTCNANLGSCTTDLGTCPTDLGVCTADLTQTQADLVACQAAPSAVFPGDGVDGPALSYTDNGNGTFTDDNTLLMWEVKDTGSGIHGVSNAYTWNNSFTAFLAVLNTSPCFAGHCDWRMPNVKELQSIVDYSKTNPASSVPGATAADGYW